VLSLAYGIVVIPATCGRGSWFTLPLSLAGLALAIVAWRKQERGVITNVALALNAVGVLAGTVLLLLIGLLRR
jgi:hypothetical protein